MITCPLSYKLTTMTNETKKSGSYDSATIKKLTGSVVEIKGSIAPEIWGSNRPTAIKNLNETVSIDGFRKGMIPENILISKIGQHTLDEEMAEIALSKAYVDIIMDNKVDAIGKPTVKITKLAGGNPLEFSILTAVIPEVKLPDYKKIAAETLKKADGKESEVTDKDVEDTILQIRKSRVPHSPETHRGEHGETNDGHDHGKMAPEEHEKIIMEQLPEFNDEFVRSLGDYENVDDFKKKVREMIGENKKSELREKTRIAIADAITNKTDVEMPELLIESELDRTEAQFASDIEHMGVKMEDYLKHAKKTIEDIRKEWRPYAEKKAKLQLILNSISSAEKIQPTKQEIEDEVDHIIEHYKDADRERAAVYAETVLTNEKVFQFLEG